MTQTPQEIPFPDRKPADAELARGLIAAQFPQWSGLPIRSVDKQGWDNRTFRLGDEMLVRLPTAQEYALAVEKEHRWLPTFAPRLPLPIPVPLARGVPDESYPHPWSVYRWLDGRPAERADIVDLTTFAVDLAEFLRALQRIDPTDGPEPGVHNWYRGGPLTTFDPWTQEALRTLDGVIRTDLAEEIWNRALRAEWDGRPVWFHGDTARNNLLVRDGRLAAVIDFGTCGVGDPACDLTIAWNLLDADGRAAFRERLEVDQATWERGQGWALWYALKSCASAVRDGEPQPAVESATVDALLTAYQRSA